MLIMAGAALTSAIISSGSILRPGEIQNRFGKYFEIQRIYHETNPRVGPIVPFSEREKVPGYAA